MEQKVRVRRKPMADINMVPYLDVMLVLLVVFMITAPMMAQGIKVALPETSSEPISIKEDDPLMVTVKKGGSYYLNLGKTPEKATSLSVVTDKISKLIKIDSKRLVLVQGDKEVPYGKVIELMSALQRSGVVNVGLVTEPPKVKM